MFMRLRRLGAGGVVLKIARLCLYGLRRLGVDLAPSRAKSLAKKYAGRDLVYFAPYSHWHVPLYQRPQHLALELGRQGFLYIFGTTENWRVVEGVRELDEGLILCNRVDLLNHFEQNRERKWLHLYSTDNLHGLDEVKAFERAGWNVLYEFVDEFCDDVTFSPISKVVRDRHEYLLDGRQAVIATAKVLLEQVPAKKEKMKALIQNAVDLDHFRREDVVATSDKVFADRISPFESVLGYYGAFASWVDWDLVYTVAERNPEIAVVLIGQDLDKSRPVYMADKAQLKNLLFFPPVPYAELPSYAVHFTTAWIPFVINNVTLSTSPLKIFEYLALGLKVLSPQLPECVDLAKVNPKVVILKKDDNWGANVDGRLGATYERSLAGIYSWKDQASKIRALLSQGSK